MALILMPLVAKDGDQRFSFSYELSQRFKGDRFKVVVCIDEGSTNSPVKKAYMHVIDYHCDSSVYYEAGIKVESRKLPARLYFAPVYSAELIGRTEDGSPLLTEAVDKAKEFLAKNRIGWEQKQASEGYLCCDLALVDESGMIVYYHPALA